MKKRGQDGRKRGKTVGGICVISPKKKKIKGRRRRKSTTKKMTMDNLISHMI
jgi:hypothetical protein